MAVMTVRNMRAMRAMVVPMVLMAGAVFAVPASADQAGDIRALNARLAADLADAQTLEHRIAADNMRARAIQVADLFGESDEEKAAEAAAAQREQAQDSSLATLNQRANDLEETLRRLTGQIEVLDHRVSEFDQRIERMQKDFDYKLCTLSAQQLGAQAAPGDTSGDAPALPCNAGEQAATPPAAPSLGVTRLAPPAGVLGTLPANAVNAAPQPEAQASGQVASIDTKGQFDSAMNLLAKAQYDEARGAFRNFADTYPADPLAPQALYWVGDIAYVQKDYETAAHTFAEELKKYPTSSRAPESMLKLGQALIAMDQKQEGCTALAALHSKYPGASKTVTTQAEALRKAGGCHR